MRRALQGILPVRFLDLKRSIGRPFGQNIDTRLGAERSRHITAFAVLDQGRQSGRSFRGDGTRPNHFLGSIWKGFLLGLDHGIDDLFWLTASDTAHSVEGDDGHLEEVIDRKRDRHGAHGPRLNQRSHVGIDMAGSHSLEEGAAEQSCKEQQRSSRSGRSSSRRYHHVGALRVSCLCLS